MALHGTHIASNAGLRRIEAQIWMSKSRAAKRPKSISYSGLHWRMLQVKVQAVQQERMPAA